MKAEPGRPKSRERVKPSALPRPVGEHGPEYEYWGMLVSAWDLLRGDTSEWPDRRFYLRLIEVYGEPVLDVGCAAGRLLLDYLEQGIDSEGVDISPEMIALCRENATRRGLKPALYEQSMAELNLPRKYRTVLVPSSSFQLLVDRTDAREAIRRFRAHLEPGGALAIPFMVLWRDGEPLDTGWRVAGEATRPADGAIVRRWSRTAFDADQRLDHTKDRFELVISGEVIATEEHSRSPATVWYSPGEASTLFEDAGFTNVRVFHGFSSTPVREGDRLFTVVGEAPRVGG